MCSVELAGSASDFTGPECVHGPSVKRTDRPGTCCADTGPTRRSIRTFASLRTGSFRPTGSPGPSCCAVVFPARTSAQPGSARGSRVGVRGCGERWRAWSPSADRAGWWLRTCLRSEAGARTGCWGNWRRWVTPAGRSWWVLPMPARPIAGHECGWWRGAYLPTPLARDWKSGSIAQRARRRACQLNDVVGGRLHPVFVEWAMGFPAGWTDRPECGESAHWATPSCPASPR